MGINDGMGFTLNEIEQILSGNSSKDEILLLIAEKEVALKEAFDSCLNGLHFCIF